MRADAVMREHGLDPNSYRKAAQMVDTTSPVTNEFLRRRMPVSEINAIYAQRVPGALWRVRYFRDSQPEEFAVVLKPDGSVARLLAHPGGGHEGRELIERRRRGDCGKVSAGEEADRSDRLEAGGVKFGQAAESHGPHTDLATERAARPAKCRRQQSFRPCVRAHECRGVGDEPADYRTFIKIPEEFERQQEEQTVVRICAWAGQICLALGLLVSVLVFFFKRLRVQPVRIPWRQFFGWGLVGLARLPCEFIFGTWHAGLFDELFDHDADAAVLRHHRRFYFTERCVCRWGDRAAVWSGMVFRCARFRRSATCRTGLGMPADYYRDAFWIGMGGSALLIGLRRAFDFVSVWWPTLHRGIPASFGDSLTRFFRELARLVELFFAGC